MFWIKQQHLILLSRSMFLNEGSNCKNINNLKLPTATKSLLRKLNPQAEFKTNFLKECKSFLIGTVQKLQEHSPGIDMQIF